MQTVGTQLIWQPGAILHCPCAYSYLTILHFKRILTYVQLSEWTFGKLWKLHVRWEYFVHGLCPEILSNNKDMYVWILLGCRRWGGVRCFCRIQVKDRGVWEVASSAGSDRRGVLLVCLVCGHSWQNVTFKVHPNHPYFIPYIKITRDVLRI